MSPVYAVIEPKIKFKNKKEVFFSPACSCKFLLKVALVKVVMNERLKDFFTALGLDVKNKTIYIYI